MRIIALAAFAAVACAPMEAPGGAEPPAGSCDISRLADLDGRPFTEQIRAEALRRSGARSVRAIRLGDVVTMDYRADRLNIHLTDNGQIDRFACG